ncbi:hypothetical protein L6Q21_13305 [Sandaracinobacter sp. RS1-74]|uniref:flagellar hook-length control protein FliK n=1 Tax=Sandaracinobacteroides sayramensis TaxID=2913411 RepID=UPI001EDAD260|nr:flagellar hook-length control protein FliK [Sandaracinobacteroides sayramensis]MCG2841960.1 hypothetical protein [Sandaracinobacteroides sayramensis]
MTATTAPLAAPPILAALSPVRHSAAKSTPVFTLPPPEPEEQAATAADVPETDSVDMAETPAVEAIAGLPVPLPLEVVVETAAALEQPAPEPGLDPRPESGTGRPLAPQMQSAPPTPEREKRAAPIPVMATGAPAPAGPAANAPNPGSGRTAAPSIMTPVATAAPIAPSLAESGRNPSDDRPRQPRASAPVAASATQMPPLRMEVAVSAPQAPQMETVIPESQPPLAQLPPPTPDMEGEASLHTPDIVVELAEGDALEVTIATATADSLARLEAAEPELRQELTALGAEVEAIRVELRPEPAPEKPQDRPTDRSPEGLSAASAGDASGRQGDRMTRHADTPPGRPQTQAENAARLRQRIGAEAANPSASTRIDRYA